MDPECVKLCEAINHIPGLRTYESCCGHGERPFYIWFTLRTVKGLRNLAHLLYWLDA